MHGATHALAVARANAVKRMLPRVHEASMLLDGGAGASKASASGGGGGASGMFSLGTNGFSAVINDPDGTISAQGVVEGASHVSVVGGRPAFNV